MAPPSTSTPAPRRWLRRLPVAGLLVLASLYWLWNGPGGGAAAALKPFEIERRADGTWPPLPADDPTLSLSFALGKASTKTNHSSSIAKSAVDGARLRSSSILVRNGSEAPLTDAVARRVIAAMQQDPQIHRIAYAPRGSEYAQGGLAPDLVLAIEQVVHHQDTFMGAGDQRAVVRATLGNQLASARVFYNDDGKYALPAVTFRQQIQVDAASHKTGIATPNAQLAATAEGVASRIVAAVRKTLGELRAEYGELPPLPEVFFPEYRSAEAVPLDAIGGLERIASWRTVLLHNETWWRGVVSGTKAEALAHIAARLREAGWKPLRGRGDSERRMRQGNREVIVFPDDVVATVGSIRVAPERPPTGTTVILRYRERASNEAIQSAIDATLAEESALEMLTLFSSAWNADQRRRAMELIEGRELHLAEDLLLRAKLRNANGDRAAAVEDLRCAHLLARTTFAREAVVKRLKKAARRLDLELDGDEATEERLLRAGFVQLPADGTPVEGTISHERPLRSFVPSTRWAVLLVAGLQRDDDGAWRGAFRRIDGSLRSEIGAIGSGTTSHALQDGTSIRLELLDAPDDGAARVRMSIER